MPENERITTVEAAGTRAPHHTDLDPTADAAYCLARFRIQREKTVLFRLPLVPCRHVSGIRGSRQLTGPSSSCQSQWRARHTTVYARQAERLQQRVVVTRRRPRRPRRRAHPHASLHQESTAARRPGDARCSVASPGRCVRGGRDYAPGFGFALRPVLDPFFSESDELARPADPEELPPDEPLAFPEPEESLRPET